VDNLKCLFIIISVNSAAATQCVPQPSDCPLPPITPTTRKRQSPIRIDRPSGFSPWGGPEVTLFQHLYHMIGHLGQHKAQLFYYLKLMGKDVNTGDLWGV